MDGASFAKDLSNQTFETAAGKIYIDVLGRKLPNYMLKQFNATTGEFMVCLFLWAVKKQHAWIIYPTDVWLPLFSL